MPLARAKRVPFLPFVLPNLKTRLVIDILVAPLLKNGHALLTSYMFFVEDRGSAPSTLNNTPFFNCSPLVLMASSILSRLQSPSPKDVELSEILLYFPSRILDIAGKVPAAPPFLLKSYSSFLVAAGFFLKPFRHGLKLPSD